MKKSSNKPSSSSHAFHLSWSQDPAYRWYFFSPFSLMDKDASSVHHCQPQQQFRHHQWWPSTLPSSTCACWTFRDSYQIRSLLWHLSCWPCRLVKEILSNRWTTGQLILEGLTNPTWGNFKCEPWKGEKWKYTNTKTYNKSTKTNLTWGN